MSEVATPAEAEAPYVDAEEPAVRTGEWRIQALADLDWAMKRRGELEAMQRANDALFKETVERLKLRLERLNKPLQNGVAFFTAAIHAYVITHRTELIGTGRKKSRALLYGTVGFRKSGGGLEVKDADALLAWARTQPVELGYVRITEAPALAEIKRAHKASGELFPGTDLAPESEEFYVKSSEEKADDDTNH